MKARGWAVTDVGKTRDHNEDSFLVNDRIGLFAVADGMGGHLGGERASRMAVEVLDREINQGITLGVTDTNEEIRAVGSAPNPIATSLRQAVGEATRSIWYAAQNDSEYSGMGTTLTGMLFHKGRATLCHVGDSRAYLYRHGQTRQITEDHSWIQEQVRAGIITADDVLASRFRNIITRSVGFEPTVEPDIITLPVEAGDCFVICSDGLSNYLQPGEMGRVLASHFYAEAARALVDIANERGGEDNITVVTVYLANSTRTPG
jgi:protein phosphatase